MRSRNIYKERRKIEVYVNIQTHERTTQEITKVHRHKSRKEMNQTIHLISEIFYSVCIKERQDATTLCELQTTEQYHKKEPISLIAY